jgi:lipopolysaccharide assembly protein A
MTEPAAPRATTTLPPPSANGSAPTPPTPPTASTASAATRGRPLRTRISSAHTALITGIAVLILVLIFVIQNAHAVTVSFLGAHLQLSLAVALLLAAIAGALIMAAVGTARITQLRQTMRRDRRKSRAGNQPS